MLTLEELASYPGTEGITADTAELLQDLALGLIHELIPAETAFASTRAKVILLEMIARAYRNGDGYTSESVDDWTGRRDTATGSPGIYLTAGERSELLALTAATARPRVRSVRLRSWSAPQL